MIVVFTFLLELAEILSRSPGSLRREVEEDLSGQEEEERYDADDEEADDEETGYLGTLRR